MTTIADVEHLYASRASYRPEIDGLRAFAVVAVIINHFNNNLLPSGYLGVDIFFVISGYVITSSFSFRSSKNFREFISGFYERRIKRLIPALLLFVVVMSVLICAFDPLPSSTLKTGIASLFGVSNIYLFSQSTDYFASSSELNIFTHTWSLGVEEQFYFVFPFLVWASGFGRHTRHGAKKLFICTLFLSIVSMIGFIYLYPRNQSAAYFLMPMRFWEMASGCLLFVALERKSGFNIYVPKIPSLPIVLAMFIVMLLPVKTAVLGTLSIVFLTLLFISFSSRLGFIYSLFSSRGVVFIGKISYSMYLWHWGILCISRWTVGIYWWTVPMQLTLIMIAAFLSYKYVELPLRRADWSISRMPTITSGIFGVTAVAGWLILLISPLKGKLYVGSPLKMSGYGVESLTQSHKVDGVDGVWSGTHCVLTSNSDVGKIIDHNKCTLGSFDDSELRVVVVGNSFSPAMIHMFNDFVGTYNGSVTLVASWGARPLPSLTSQNHWAKANTYYWKTIVPDLIGLLQAGDVVFVVNEMAGWSPKFRKTEDARKLNEFETALRLFSSQLREKNINLLMLHGLPFAREAACDPVVAVKQWFSPWGRQDCHIPSKIQTLERRKALNELLMSFQSEDLIRVVDLLDVFCPGAECSYQLQDGTIIYRDEYSHPTNEISAKSGPIVTSALKNIFSLMD